MNFLAYSLAVGVSYLLGSIPTGYLAGRMRGIDVRKSGSGNIGATNVFRVLGRTAGIAVLLIDAAKGFVAVWFVPKVMFQLFPPTGLDAIALALVCGVAVILGHNYTCWLAFKGGKGIATSAGVVMAWAPLACVCALVVWLIVFLASRYVSLASIAAALVLPISVWFFSHSIAMTIVMAFLSAMAIYKHKANIQRLLNGTENRMGAKKP